MQWRFISISQKWAGIIGLCLLCSCATYHVNNYVPWTFSHGFNPASLDKVAVLARSDNRYYWNDRMADSVEEIFTESLLRNGYQVISRSNLGAVQNEIDFQRSGSSPEADAAKWGRIMNVPAIILVRVSDVDVKRGHGAGYIYYQNALSAKARVSATLIRTEDGAVLGSGSRYTQTFAQDYNDFQSALYPTARLVANGLRRYPNAPGNPVR